MDHYSGPDCRSSISGHCTRDPRRPGCSPASDAIEITVIGHQYWWEFRYPKVGIVTANEMHIPVSDPTHPRPAFLQLLSADTDHSFWVPELAGKTDLVPNPYGQKTHLDLGSENPILGGKILVPQQQFLVHRSGDVRQHARPDHFPTFSIFVVIGNRILRASPV